MDIPQGAEEADGESLRRVVRDQIGRGADVIKVYADNAAGADLLGRGAAPGRRDRRVAGPAGLGPRHEQGGDDRGRPLAGVATIEHGDGGDAEVFRLMADRGVAFCPTLTVFEASARFRGYRPGVDPEPARLRQARAAFKLALAAGVTIINGSDVGAFAHGELGRELELMVDFGMKPPEALRAATSTAARVLGLDDKVGADQAGPPGRPRRGRGRPDPRHRGHPQGPAGDEGRRPPSRALTPSPSRRSRGPGHPSSVGGPRCASCR